MQLHMLELRLQLWACLLDKRAMATPYLAHCGVWWLVVGKGSRAVDSIGKWK